MDADAQSYRRTVDGGKDVTGAVRHGQGERGHLSRVVRIVDGQSGRAHVRIPDGLDLIQLELVCQMVHDTIQPIQNANDFYSHIKDNKCSMREYWNAKKYLTFSLYLISTYPMGKSCHTVFGGVVK